MISQFDILPLADERSSRTVTQDRVANTKIAAYLEPGAKRIFACAYDWPGWCRSGKDEQQALAALGAYAPRYASVAAEARLPFSPSAGERIEVVERLPGSTTTDFGAPDKIPAHDWEPITDPAAERLAALVAATWTVFDRVVTGAPAELRKGPRGGGRDRDAVVAHVLAAETAYARKLGVRQRQPPVGDEAAILVLRAAIGKALRAGSDALRTPAKGWPAPYAARRIAWHALDHAWEIEDRSSSPA
jgi:hypothetical protein